MASTALQTEQEKKEYFDKPEVLDEKITLLAEAIKKSKHFVMFTGAGISTATGIPDFRSGINTVLPTGPGAWEKLATHSDKQGTFVKPMLSALPSKTHMAIIELTKRGILKFVISQNVDGLHRRSGLNPELLAELHGNTNLQKCLECQRQYFRDYKCSGKRENAHRTGRKCECGGDLADSIIHFGESLPQKDLLMGYNHSEIADVHLCIGSSLRVSPANDMPFQTVKNGGQLFIVNLQKTPLEDNATNIFGLCDNVMELLMKKLEIPIPEFELQRNFLVSLEMQKYVVFGGIDIDGTPYSLFKQIKVEDSAHKTFLLQQEPFVLELGSFKGGLLKLDLQFPGHYDQPNLKIDLESDFINQYEPLLFKLAYNPQTGQWRTLN